MTTTSSMKVESQQCSEGDVVRGIGKIMEKVVDKVIDRMMDKVMDRMTEKWRIENRDRVSATVAETMSETAHHLIVEAQTMESAMGNRVGEMVDKVVVEVANMVEKMMEKVEKKLEGNAVDQTHFGHGDTAGSQSDQESVCEMYSSSEEQAEEEDEYEEPPLTQNQKDAFYEIFKEFTRKAEDFIDFVSLQFTLASVGARLKDEKVHRALEVLDSDGDNRADFEDFLNLLTNTKLFFKFFGDLPDRCEGTGLHKGFVDNTIFFELLSKFIEFQLLSEDSVRKIIKYYYQKKKGAKLLTKDEGAKNLPTFLGQTVYNLVNYVDILQPDADYKEADLTNDQIAAFRNVFEIFNRTGEDNVGVDHLLDMMKQVQIYLKNPLVPNDVKVNVVNQGRPVGFQDFLAIMTDTATFRQYLAPVYKECKGEVDSDVVLFEAITRLVDSSILTAKTKGIITVYYRSKFQHNWNVDKELPEKPPSALQQLKGDQDKPRTAPSSAAPRPTSRGGTLSGRNVAMHDQGKVTASSTGRKHHKEPGNRKRNDLEKRFAVALQNPAFKEAFNAYSWTWRNRADVEGGAP